jgi:acetoin utilization deacetylase AcuC-like enzyme
MQIIYTPYHTSHDPAGVLQNGAPLVYEEVPARIEIILAAVQTVQLGPVLNPVDHGIGPLEMVHDRDYLKFLSSVYEECASRSASPQPVFAETFGMRRLGRKPSHPVAQAGYYSFGTGTPILAGTWQAAYWSAQTALTAADWVRSGSKAAYALCRPPGHHAARDLYGGFCFLNNAAIAAASMPGRVTILDVDYHHGNGTQDIFYADPRVQYCSIHAHPDDEYPYFWGGVDEIGQADGAGFNLNRPLPRGTNDDEYLAALAQVLAEIDSFAPNWLIISFGLDIGEDDPVGGFAITTAGFQRIASAIHGLNIPTVIVQEGGYRLERLGEWALAFLQPFAG